MIKRFRRENGITITTLVITIILIIIITGVLAINSKTNVQVSNLTKLQNDIEALNDRVAAYFVQNGKLPIIEEDGVSYDKLSLSKTLKDEMAANDGENYYTIDISKIDNITLNYGNDYLKSTSMDKYIINEETHVIYYLKGVSFDGVIYHTVGANPPVV